MVALRFSCVQAPISPPTSFPPNLPRSMTDSAAALYRDRDKDRDRDRDRDREQRPQHQRMPSLERANTSQERINPGPARQPSRAGPSQGLSHSTSQAALTASATNEVVVPNKSTIAEERMEVPYAKFGDDKDDESPDEDINRNGSRSRSQQGGRYEKRSQDDSRPSMEDQRGETRPDLRTRASEASVKSASRRNESVSSMNRFNLPGQSSSSNKGIVPDPNTSSSNGAELARERKLRADLESKVAGLERRLQGMEKDLDDAGRREKWERDRTKELENEVRGMKEHSRNHADELRSMQREIDNTRTLLDAEKQKVSGRQREDQVETAKWKERYQAAADEALNLRKQVEERSGPFGGGQAGEAAKELQNELVILMEELKALSIRNEEMMTEKDADLATIRELDQEVRLYKRKWEDARTDLRNLKGEQASRQLENAKTPFQH